MSSFMAVWKQEAKDNAKAMGRAVKGAYKASKHAIQHARGRDKGRDNGPEQTAAVPHVTSQSVLVVHARGNQGAAPGAAPGASLESAAAAAESGSPLAALAAVPDVPKRHKAYHDAQSHCDGKSCKCCVAMFKGGACPVDPAAREWQEAFEGAWPIDDNRRWLCEDESQVEEVGQPVGTWRRNGQWFQHEFGPDSAKDWRIACHMRFGYASTVDAAVARGAKGYVPVAEQGTSASGRAAMVHFGDSPVVTREAMQACIVESLSRAPPAQYAEFLVSPKAVFEFGAELDSKFVAAFLDLTEPEEACCSVEDGNRYDWYWPHVAQLGHVHMVGSSAEARQVVHANGPRSFFSDGGTVVTCRADGAFGVVVYAFGAQWKVVIWGAALLTAIRRELPHALESATVKLCDKAAAPPTATVQAAFSGVADGATNWKLEIYNP